MQICLNFSRMKYLLLLVSFFCVSKAYSQWETYYEKNNKNGTAPYAEIVDYYTRLSKAFPKLGFTAKGPTDAGFPLHLLTYSNDGTKSPQDWHRKGKIVIMVLNGIHSGEPDGVDASMMLLRLYILTFSG